LADAPTCPRCKGTRYLIEKTGERSVARLCDCAGECDRCNGTGRLYLERDGYSYAQPCSCRSLALRVARFNHARLPARGGLSFDEFLPFNEEQAKARDAAITTAKRYRPDAPSRGFGVAGPVGTGKTHLLSATLAYLTLEAGVSARYVEASFLFSEIRRGFSENRSGLEAIQPLIDTDVLAIDELGKGRGSAFELDTLDELIARRYNTHRTTLFATNYSLATERPRPKGYSDPVEQMQERPSETPFREKVGERIYSRLHEMCYLIQFPATTQDYRRRTSK